jgi:hypothetical protein
MGGEVFKAKGGLMTKAKFIIAIMGVLIILPGTVWGFHNKINKKSLEGIKGVQVLIEMIRPEIERDGLTHNQIQTDTEQRLRLAGLRVLSLEELSKTLGKPILNVAVDIRKEPGGVYIYNIELSLIQDVYLMRNNKLIPCITWHRAGLGRVSSLTRIRNTIKDYIDLFINAWLSVNQKK